MNYALFALIFAATIPVIPAMGDRTVKFQEGWTTWSPRAEIAPKFSQDPSGGRNGHPALKIEAGATENTFGKWQKRIEDVTPGKSYTMTAYYRAQGVPFERKSVAARLVWMDAKGGWVRPPDYALDAGKEGAWTRVEHTATAPENAKSVSIELSLQWAPKGVVWWDDVQFGEESSPRNRAIKAVTIFHRPRGTKSAAESVAQFCKLVEESAAQKPDIVCLPEGITVVGNGKSYAEVGETVPGPTTQTLGSLAKRLNTYIVAGLYERVGSVIYNTAVLIDRDGQFAGKYRKTHLPREEVEAGLTPGNDYPVFKTDFGTVGIMICWDLQFPEPARAMALKGAEVILLPIWGGSEVLARARAIENHVFLVSSSYDMKTFIVAPDGAVLSEATESKPIASAELKLDQKIVQPWLGDMKTRTWKERRPDIPIEPVRAK
jgi:predicted amidohydrolase